MEEFIQLMYVFQFQISVECVNFAEEQAKKFVTGEHGIGLTKKTLSY